MNTECQQHLTHRQHHPRCHDVNYKQTTHKQEKWLRWHQIRVLFLSYITQQFKTNTLHKTLGTQHDNCFTDRATKLSWCQNSTLDFTGAKDDGGGGGDNCSYKTCRAPIKLSHSTNQHPAFLQAGWPSYRPTNSVRALKGNVTYSEFKQKLEALRKRKPLPRQDI